MKITTLSRGTAFLAALGVVELLFTVFAARVADRETTYPLYLALYLAMGATWLVASYYVTSHVTGNPSPRRADLRLVVLVAVVLRVPFLLTEPLLSDDIFRYVWDGRVQHAGINPYLYAPEAQELAFLRDGHEHNFAGINNKEFSDYLGGALAKAKLGEWQASEQTLDLGTRLSWSEKTSEIKILHGLLKQIRQNFKLEIIDDAYVDRLAEEVGASGDSTSIFVPDIRLFCPHI